MTPWVLRPAKEKKGPVILIFELMEKSQTMSDDYGSLLADSLAKLEQSVFLVSKVPAMQRQVTMRQRQIVLGLRYLVELDYLRISSVLVDPSW